MRIRASGYLGNRLRRNYDRLEREEYRPDAVFKKEYGWPADWEGRIMLALAMLSDATGREPAYLEDMMVRMPSQLNEKGYFGKVYPAGELDEQQLSGHSWLLRAMCEVYERRQDERALAHVQRIVEALLLPAAGYYRQYPVRPEHRAFEGGAIGTSTGVRVGHWYPSTDIGCAFIMLDGATHAYRLLRMPELGALIDEMIDTLRTIDLTGLAFQTHATLSAARGVLRHYETTGNEGLLGLAGNIYDLYRSEGMTEHYANYNWFGRPEWTEPCAVVDSFLLAFGLWKHTGSIAYLEDAHAILYNGLSYGQRPNGGFGCDRCAGAEDAYLSPRDDLFEAPWCCSMRGGDGLASAALSLYVRDERGVTLPLYNDSELAEEETDGRRWTIRQETEYPFAGVVRLKIAEADGAASRRLRLYVPSWCGKGEVSIALNGERVPFVTVGSFAELDRVWRAGDVLELRFPVPLRTAAVNNERHRANGSALRHGVLALGAATDEAKLNVASLKPLGGAKYKDEANGTVYGPLTDFTAMAEADAVGDRRRLLFAVDGAG